MTEYINKEKAITELRGRSTDWRAAIIIEDEPATKVIEREKIDKAIKEIESARWCDKDTKLVRNANASGLDVALGILKKCMGE